MKDISKAKYDEDIILIYRYKDKLIPILGSKVNFDNKTHYVANMAYQDIIELLNIDLMKPPAGWVGF